MLTLITGGVKSGKSRYALDLASRDATAQSKCFIATAESMDEEMRTRIDRHQMERGSDWSTREAPVHVAAALLDRNASYQYFVIDCLTLWVNNLLHYQASQTLDIEQEILQLESALKRVDVPIVIVTNEVGLGVIPENPLSRRYMDLLGSVNQRIARLADRMVLMVSGIPMELKERRYEKLER
jgi:adenosylcobinamide kinase / adenosylcobinamide-phosphate guanylyltransferase